MPKCLWYLLIKTFFSFKNHQVKITLQKYASDYVTPVFYNQGREMDNFSCNSYELFRHLSHNDLNCML